MTQDLIPQYTWNQLFGNIEIGSNPFTQPNNSLISGNKLIGGSLIGTDYRSAETGARVEIRPNDDNNIGLVVYDDDGNKVFETIIDGTNVGDVNIGNVAGNQGIFYDKSTGVLEAGGEPITDIINQVSFANGVFAKNMADADGDTVIAHGLGRTPKFVRMTMRYIQSGFNRIIFSDGTYNGTNTRCVYVYWIDGGAGTSTTYIIYYYYSTADNSHNKATITVDATNITLSWVKNGTPTGEAQIMWEAV